MRAGPIDDALLVRRRSSDPKSPVVVLLHGFMGVPEDLAAFASSLGVEAEFFFPAAPVKLEPQGLRGRGWWAVDVDERSAALAKGPRDLSDWVPEGLDDARETFGEWLDASVAELGPRPLIVGGFSQGAMLAFDWALRTTRELAGLVMFSGSPIARGLWADRYASRRGQKAFLSHGRGDDDLAFGVTEAFQRRLVDCRWDVTWQPFDGGHEIPLVVWRRFKRWLLDLRR